MTAQTARKRVSLGILALTWIGLVACQAPSAGRQQAPPQVTVATPVRADVTPVYEFTGTTDAFRSVEIRARVQGFLEEIRFSPSSFVKAGDVLFVIEQEPFLARRDRAKANLTSAEAALRRAESDLERLEQAVKTNAVSQQEVTRARAERDQAEAALLGARADLESAEIELDYTRIESPVDGLISRNLVDQGNLVGPSTNSLLATVRRIDPVYAYFEVNERLFSRMLDERGGHAGKMERETEIPAVLSVEETGLRIEGRIDSIDNTVDPSTGTIMLRAVFPNPDARVFPGFFVTVLLSGDVRPDAILVQEKAVGTDLGGKFLLLVDTDNVVQQRYVSLGPAREDGTVVVSEGLDGDERYIVDGLLRARPGLPVSPKFASLEEGS
jgi:RND family efflux transporter MFP subunit